MREQRGKARSYEFTNLVALFWAWGGRHGGEARQVEDVTLRQGLNWPRKLFSLCLSRT